MRGVPMVPRQEASKGRARAGAGGRAGSSMACVLAALCIVPGRQVCAGSASDAGDRGAAGPGSHSSSCRRCHLRHPRLAGLLLAGRAVQCGARSHGRQRGCGHAAHDPRHHRLARHHGCHGLARNPSRCLSSGQCNIPRCVVVTCMGECWGWVGVCVERMQACSVEQTLHITTDARTRITTRCNHHLSRQKPQEPSPYLTVSGTRSVSDGGKSLALNTGFGSDPLRG
mmetsp:Transcript_29915/g.97879  ORF Transcript_29915/g.97879 Transcript_29915/m.97879 type:complete len:227 (+) Transcript_29915:571-1251(+)